MPSTHLPVPPLPTALHTPSCILELNTAIEAGVPIISLYIRGKDYDFAQAQQYLTYLDTELDKLNPTGSEVLLKHGLQPIDAAYNLSQVVPNIISIELDASASNHVINAQMADLMEQMRSAAPVKIAVSKEQWLAERGSAKTTPAGGHQPAAPWTGGVSNNAGAIRLVPLPVELPAPVRGFVMRESVMAKSHEILLDDERLCHAAPTLVYQGMGGSGKTVAVVALARDLRIRKGFDAILYAAVGQNPSIRDLQRSLHVQLCGNPMPPEAAADDQQAVDALREQAKGKHVLMIVDDAWTAGPVEKLASFLDPQTRSRRVVTTRIQDLVPGLVEIQLGVLPADESARLMLTVGDAPNKEPPYSKEILEAAEACGGLPLTLAVAGGMLQDQFGGVVTPSFVEMLKEDHGEVLREGKFGDEHVAIEDRLITASLKNYVAAERDNVMKTFQIFAAMPEDVGVPVPFFDMLAKSKPGLFGMKEGTKRPHLKVRSWLTALKKLSLLMGTMMDGFFQHDIVRDYAISRCEDLVALQRDILDAVVAGRPEPDGWPMREGLERGTDKWHVAVNGWWHVRGAVGSEALGSDAVALVHRLVAADPGVAEACAWGVGHERMLGLVEKAEQEKKWMVAAQLLLATSRPATSGLRRKAEEGQFMLRAQAVLERELDDDDEATMFELVLLVEMMHVGCTRLESGIDLGERSLLLAKRASERGLGGPRNYEKVCEESAAMMLGYFAKLKVLLRLLLSFGCIAFHQEVERERGSEGGRERGREAARQ